MAPHLQIINGSILEGGGQILRNSISMAALLQKPVRIENIRAGRSQPGLKSQHRTGLDLVARIASAQLTGATNGSSNVEFIPGGIQLPGQWKADAVTAGATTLLLQIALPLLLFQSATSTPSPSPGPSVLTLLGGTNAGQAPQVDYIQHVFLPFFRNHFLPPPPPPTLEQETTTTTSTSTNARIKLEIRKRGYYPKGGGEIDVRVWPLLPGQKLRAVNLVERGRLVAIHGLAHCAGLPRLVGEGMSQGAMTRIKEWAADKNRLLTTDNGDAAAPADDETNRVSMNVDVKREPNGLTRGAGSGIVLWAEFENGVVIGGSAVGKKGLEPREVGKSAAEELIKGIEAEGCVDEWMQDQIIIFMALAEGKSKVKCGTNDLTLHTKTAIWVAQQLTEAKFDVDQEDNGSWTIHCEGIGFPMS